MHERSAGVPCMRVDDAPATAAYYRDVLGFEQVALLGGVQPTFAIVRKYGATLLLQQVTNDGALSSPPDRPSGPPWDAVLLVDDVQGAHRELAARGVESLSSIDGKGIGWDSFDFRDRCGNIVCIGQSSEEFFASIQPPTARSRPLAQLIRRRQRARSARQEQGLLRDFQAFYERLENKEDAFYMFFTSDLLHWVIHAESYVPRDVNLVLLGSGLTRSERQWIGENLDRPFHHIRLPVDDVTAWEFIFATSSTNFGWLDIDCFVLDSTLFQEITSLPSDASMNCTWSWDSGYGFRVAGTHFLFLKADTIRAVEKHGISPSPCTYDWTGGERKFPPRKCFMKIPTEEEAALLREVVPADGAGRPMFLEGAYYNTLVVYQLLARALGYPIHQVRDLDRRCSLPIDAESTDPKHWPEDMSEELFHLFGVSYYKTHHHEPGIRALYLASDYILLENTKSRLPAQYAQYQARIATELAKLGLPPEQARDRFRRHLIEGRKLSEAAADRILSSSVRLTT